MKTCSPYISIILDGEEFEAEQICRINKSAEDKDWSIRQLLHTIFSDFRKGMCVPTVVIYNDEEELFIVESYFWEESLALIGKRDTVKAFKHKIDTLPKQFWNAIFSKEKELETLERHHSCMSRGIVILTSYWLFAILATSLNGYRASIFRQMIFLQ